MVYQMTQTERILDKIGLVLGIGTLLVLVGCLCFNCPDHSFFQRHQRKKAKKSHDRTLTEFHFTPEDVSDTEMMRPISRPIRENHRKTVLFSDLYVEMKNDNVTLNCEQPVSDMIHECKTSSEKLDSNLGRRHAEDQHPKQNEHDEWENTGYVGELLLTPSRTGITRQKMPINTTV